jgi:hypothetical protein
MAKKPRNESTIFNASLFTKAVPSKMLFASSAASTTIPSTFSNGILEWRSRSLDNKYL